MEARSAHLWIRHVPNRATGMICANWRAGQPRDLITRERRLNAQSDNGFRRLNAGARFYRCYCGRDKGADEASPTSCLTWRSSSFGSAVGRSQVNARHTWAVGLPSTA